MSPRCKLDILVVGGGTFATALGTILVDLGRQVRLWVRRPDQAEEINGRHTNSRYLPGVALLEGLQATTDLGEAVRGAPVVLIVVPSRSFRLVARAVGDHIEGDQILLHATKGIEIETFKRMSQILREETCALKVGVLSGPNLAAEIMAGQPTGALVASRYHEVVERTQELLSCPRFRVYSGRDVVGTEIGGSFKNIIALAAGVADGLGLGDNAKALLMTRGLSEMARFGVALGADVFTSGGLAGIGDLMATCASPLSRNHQVGERLARGEGIQEILSTMTQVAEGVPTTEAVYRQALAMGIRLPIVWAMRGMLAEGWPASRAMEELIRISVGEEMAMLRF